MSTLTRGSFPPPGIQKDLADLASSNDAESESDLRERTPDTEDSGAQSLPTTQGLTSTHSTFRSDPPHLQSFRWVWLLCWHNIAMELFLNGIGAEKFIFSVGWRFSNNLFELWFFSGFIGGIFMKLLYMYYSMIIVACNRIAKDTWFINCHWFQFSFYC